MALSRTKSFSEDLISPSLHTAERLIFTHGLPLTIAIVTMPIAHHKGHDDMAKFAAGFLFAYVLVRMLHACIEKSIKTRHLDQTLIHFVERVAKYVTSGAIFYCLLWCLGVAGDVTSPQLVAAVSLAWGLATQDIVSHFVSGALLVVLRPFHVGDIIGVDGTFATVTRIGLFFTHCVDVENHEIKFPNNKTLNCGSLANWSRTTTRNFRLFVNIRTGQCSCSDVRKALEQGAAEIDKTIGGVIEKEGQTVDPERNKTVVQGPIQFTNEGMQWLVIVAAPGNIFNPIVQHGMAHMHDALYNAGIEIFEYGGQPSKRQRTS